MIFETAPRYSFWRPGQRDEPSSPLHQVAFVPADADPRVIVSHPADQGVAYRAAAACQSLGFPFRFLTGLYYRPDKLPYAAIRLLPDRPRRRLESSLERRRFSALDDNAVVSLDLPLLEILSRVVRSARPRDSVHDRLAARWLRRHGRPGGWSLFHGFVGSCLFSLRAARERGLTTILEVTAPPTMVPLVAAERQREGLAVGPYVLSPRQLDEMRQADYYIAQSPFVVGELRRLGLPAERIFLIPLGIELACFHPSPEGADDGRFRALFVGGLSVHKGLHHLLRAWSKLQLDGAELLVAGYPVDPPVLAELSRTPGAHWLGKIPPNDMPSVYRRADIFVCPSLSEGGPFVVLEAMASGLPTIVSDHAAAMVRTGVDGLVVPAGDIETLGAAIRRLHDDPRMRRELGQAARQRALGFDWSARYRRLGLAYRHAISGISALRAGEDCIDLTDM